MRHHASAMGGEITVQLYDAGGNTVPIEGVQLDLKFYMQGRLRYCFSLGRTDSLGRCQTSVKDVERQLEENRRDFLMDYNTPLADCDAEVGIVAPAPEELHDRESARQKAWPEQPPIYADAANHRVRCREQRFQLQSESRNAFELVCEIEA